MNLIWIIRSETMTLSVISSGNNNNIKCLFFNKLWGQIDHELKIDHEGVSPSKDKRTDPAAACRSDMGEFAPIAQKYTCLKKRNPYVAYHGAEFVIMMSSKGQTGKANIP